MSDWLDTNGLDLARLLVQIVILAAIVVYSRRILRTLMASQQQIGALLRLSVTDGTAHERHASIDAPAIAPPGFSAPAFAEKEEPSAAIPSMFPAPSLTPRTPAFAPERQQSLGGRIVAERIALEQPEPAQSMEAPSLTPWVAAPVNGDSERAEGFAEKMADSTRNLGRWLNEPPRRSSNGGNPLRRLIRWLQAPAGSRASRPSLS
jgi:hypothetical protein